MMFSVGKPRWFASGAVALALTGCSQSNISTKPTGPNEADGATAGGDAFDRLVLPTVTLLSPVSPIAWLPVAIFLFGIGNGPAIFMVVVALFFHMVLATVTQIDGVSNTFADGSGHARVAFNPPASSIGQFKIITNPFDASAGNTLGATVNVSTKSGTNQIHGEGHYYGRNNFFDTMDFFSNKNNVAQTVYQDNRYGLEGGGPVLIPKLYNGKNKTFWHFTWEANEFGDPNVGTITSTVPRAAWRTGDLSDLLKIGANYQVYDPSTIAVAPNGRFSRLPFAGNMIPPSRIDPISKNLLNLYPLPNQAGTVDGRHRAHRVPRRRERRARPQRAGVREYGRVVGGAPVGHRRIGRRGRAARARVRAPVAPDLVGGAAGQVGDILAAARRARDVC